MVTDIGAVRSSTDPGRLQTTRDQARQVLAHFNGFERQLGFEGQPDCLVSPLLLGCSDQVEALPVMLGRAKKACRPPKLPVGGRHCCEGLGRLEQVAHIVSLEGESCGSLGGLSG